MRDITLPKIDYNNFAQTRDTIQKYAQLLSAIKGKLVPHQKNWEEYSLNIYAKGFTTSPIPIETSMGIEALDLNLNLIEHKLKISYKDNRDEINLEQSTNADFTKKLLDILTSYEIELEKQDENFFSEEKPKIAVAALNTHAGEGGLFGKEEEEIILPAVREAQRLGINVEGPMPPDTLFYHAAQGAYSAVVSMYHDQGLIPLKLLHFEDAVNITLGLPIIRTSVDHGTAYDIAGTGKANPSSLLNALKLAAGMVVQRVVRN